MLTSAGKSLKPKVTFFSSAVLWAWLKTTVSGLTWMPPGSMPVPSDWMNVMRCFIVVLCSCWMRKKWMSRLWHWLSLKWLKLNTLSRRCTSTRWRCSASGSPSKVHVSQQNQIMASHHAVNKIYGLGTIASLCLLHLLYQNVKQVFRLATLIFTRSHHSQYKANEKLLLCFSMVCVDSLMLICLANMHLLPSAHANDYILQDTWIAIRVTAAQALLPIPSPIYSVQCAIAPSASFCQSAPGRMGRAWA